MKLLLIIIFAVTLIYLSVTERFRTFITLIAAQGLALFGIAFLELTDISIGNLIFIIAETLLFKAIIVPLLLSRIIKQTRITRVHEHNLPSLYALIFISFGLVVSILLTYMLDQTGMVDVYFAIAFFTVYTGMFFIISHKKIFSHLIGFLVIENAVFMLSLAVGSEMPMLINIGILLDIVVSVLILGIFVNRLGNLLNAMDAKQLSELKD